MINTKILVELTFLHQSLVKMKKNSDTQELKDPPNLLIEIKLKLEIRIVPCQEDIESLTITNVKFSMKTRFINTKS
jgi:thiamine pyrophosphokinase